MKPSCFSVPGRSARTANDARGLDTSSGDQRRGTLPPFPVDTVRKGRLGGKHRLNARAAVQAAPAMFSPGRATTEVGWVEKPERRLLAS